MLKRTLVARALAAAFATTALSLAIAPVAWAQTNATGTIFGNAGKDSGNVVVVESLATAAKHTATPDSTGRFQITSLPPGLYKVQLMKGTEVLSTVQLEVLLGQGVEAIFGTLSRTAELQAVQVVGSRSSIDVSTTNNGATFTAKQLNALPIAQNLNAVIDLAPDTVKADPRYSGGASIGGGAPSENSYYINGFPVTNALSQLGSIELPFGAIQQAQVLTGGFGAEFGRSTGGVVNITTKSGSNTWEGGASVSVQPQELNSLKKNIYYPANGLATDGQLSIRQDQDSTTEVKYGAYVGGPIIADKLFFFVAADQTKTNLGFVNGTSITSTLGSGGWVEEKDVNNRYLAKLDWNITDNHHLEFTALGDNYWADQNYYSYNYATNTKGSNVNYTGHFENIPYDGTIAGPGHTPGVGGDARILKYTGNLTNDLTLTALYGESTANHQSLYAGSGLSNTTAGVTWTSTGRAPGVNYINAQPLATSDLPAASAQDTTKAFRLDLEWNLGKHTLRAGMDNVKLHSADAGQVEAGGSTWSYRFTPTPGTAISAGPYTFLTGANGNALGQAGYYVRQHIFSDTTDARSDQQAQYIEDRWQAAKDVLVTLGLRNESFQGLNGDGQKYLDSKNFISPRLGAAWDVNGDSSLKVFGNLGRYSIQTPTHLAVRGASRSTLTYQYFSYTGVDPVTGAPTGAQQLTPVYSPDGENGQAKDPNTVAAQNLKPSYQDELILGLDKALTSKITGGAKVTYRRLGATLDDFCDGRPFEKYAADHGIDTTNWGTDGACIFINPGQSNTFLVDYAGTGTNYTKVALSAADIGLPKAERTFLALDFYLEHAFSDGWYGKLSYTWSQNKGNTEGQTRSDIAQTDVSATETWDFPQIMEGAYGFLPNDRTHVIKAIGYAQATPEIGFGTNIELSSGRPKNCFGNYGGTDPEGDPGYGSAFFYCQFAGQTAPVATPRGSQGRLPWSFNVDVNAIYQPSFVKGLGLRVDIFNLFNRQSVQAINEVHENDGSATSILATYGRTIAYSAPRAVKLSAEYHF